MKNARGYTVIEVLISTVVISILIIASFAVLNVGRSSWFKGDVQSELRKEMIRGFMAMERELRETRPAEQSVPFGEARTTITFKIPLDSADADSTILDSNGIIEWSGNIVYSLNGSNEIIRSDSSGTPRVLARGISNLQFSRTRNPALPQDLIIINITGQKASGTGEIATQTGQLIVRMRN